MYAAPLSLSLSLSRSLSLVRARARTRSLSCSNSLLPATPRENSKKLNGVDEKLEDLLHGVNDELKGLKESLHRVEEGQGKDDEDDRQVKRGREEEFAIQMGSISRVTWRSCMRDASAAGVASVADCVLVELAGCTRQSFAPESNPGGPQTAAQDYRGWEARCPRGDNCCSRREQRDRAVYRLGPRRRRDGESAAPARVQIMALFFPVC
jgi:hypothetical protein